MKNYDQNIMDVTIGRVFQRQQKFLEILALLLSTSYKYPKA